MNKLIFFLLCITLSSCSSKTGISESYSEKPINTDCAYSSIKKSGNYDLVEQKKYEIIFANKAVKGKLYHGTEEGKFTNFGIEISTHPFWGADPQKLSSDLYSIITDSCTK